MISLGVRKVVMFIGVMKILYFFLYFFMSGFVSFLVMRRIFLGMEKSWMLWLKVFCW